LIHDSHSSTPAVCCFPDSLPHKRANNVETTTEGDEREKKLGIGGNRKKEPSNKELNVSWPLAQRHLPETSSCRVLQTGRKKNPTGKPQRQGYSTLSWDAIPGLAKIDDGGTRVVSRRRWLCAGCSPMHRRVCTEYTSRAWGSRPTSASQKYHPRPGCQTPFHTFQDADVTGALAAVHPSVSARLALSHTRASLSMSRLGLDTA